MSEPYKLQVKLGQHEFNAEGPEDTVKEQFQLFLTAMQSAPAPRTPPNPRGLKGASNQNNGDDTERLVGELEGEIEPEVLRRVFLEGEDSVSLRMLPRTNTRDADAVLLLLYGHKAMKDQHDLVSPRIIKTAKQSGVTVERVDRVLEPHKSLYTKGGFKRGSRYGLNNQGVAHAELLIRQMLN